MVIGVSLPMNPVASDQLLGIDQIIGGIGERQEAAEQHGVARAGVPKPAEQKEEIARDQGQPGAEAPPIRSVGAGRRQNTEDQRAQ